MPVSSLVFLFLAAAPTQPPEAVAIEDYFMVFTADRTRYNPARAHTFAAVVRIERTASEARVASVASLSWLPVTMKVRPLALRPEVGRNVPLLETLQWATDNGDRINMWGPYRVQTEFADTFRARVNTVESRFQYRGACLTSPLTVCDCARSVEEMIEPRRRYIGFFGYGAAAGSYIVKKFHSYLIDPEQTHPWVGSAIGLDSYTIRARAHGDYDDRMDQLRAMLNRK